MCNRTYFVILLRYKDEGIPLSSRAKNQQWTCTFLIIFMSEVEDYVVSSKAMFSVRSDSGIEMQTIVLIDKII